MFKSARCFALAVPKSNSQAALLTDMGHCLGTTKQYRASVPAGLTLLKLLRDAAVVKTPLHAVDSGILVLIMDEA